MLSAADDPSSPAQSLVDDTCSLRDVLSAQSKYQIIGQHTQIPLQCHWPATVSLKEHNTFAEWKFVFPPFIGSTLPKYLIVQCNSLFSLDIYNTAVQANGHPHHHYHQQLSVAVQYRQSTLVEVPYSITHYMLCVFVAIQRTTTTTPTRQAFDDHLARPLPSHLLFFRQARHELSHHKSSQIWCSHQTHTSHQWPAFPLSLLSAFSFPSLHLAICTLFVSSEEINSEKEVQQNLCVGHHHQHHWHTSFV